MIGAIAGDIIGSVYEHRRIKTKDFPLFHPQCTFTDDTVLTIAVADDSAAGSLGYYRGVLPEVQTVSSVIKSVLSSPSACLAARLRKFIT